MGTGGKIITPKTTPIYIVACPSNSGCNLSFEDEDVFLNKDKAEDWCKQKNAKFKSESGEKKNYYFVERFNAKE
jgi:hypothetical protein